MKLIKNSKIYFLSLISMFFIILAVGSGDIEEVPTEDISEQENSSSESVAKESVPVTPTIQSDFEAVRKSFFERYEEAQNDIKKSAVFTDANNHAKKFRKDNEGMIKNFVGKLTSMRTDQGGEHVSIVVQSKNSDIKVSYKTWSSSFSDMDDSTRPKKGSSVYNQIAELNEGDYVVFSAKILRDSQRGMKEGSMTERGSLRAPEFIVKFTDIKKAE